MRLRPGRPLLAASARPWVLAVAAGCAAMVAALGLLFEHQSTADWLDHAVDARVIRAFADHRGVPPLLITPGSPRVALIATAVLVIACLVAGRLNGALLAAAAVPLADGLCEKVLKPVVQRIYLGQGAYPSGHSTAVFALAATVIMLVAFPGRPVRTAGLRMLLAAAVLATGVGVAAGLVAIRFHYFTDTAGGAALGVGTVCALALVLDLPVVRRLLDRVTGRPAEPQMARHARTERSSA